LGNTGLDQFTIWYSPLGDLVGYSVYLSWTLTSSHEQFLSYDNFEMACNDNAAPLRSFSPSVSSEEELDEWQPPEPKVPRKTTKDPASGEKKPAAKRTAKPKEPKAPKPPKEPKAPKPPKEPKAPKPPKEPKAPKPPKEPKPRAPRKMAAKASTSTVGPGRKRKHADSVDEAVKQSCGEDGGGQSDLPGGSAEGGLPGATLKEEVSMM